MEKKFELTEETIKLYGHTFHRIKALKDFGDVKKGDLGGFVEKEDNLSQYDDCWVFNDAQVYGSAKVFGKAQVFDNAEVYGDARVSYKSIIHDNAKVYGNARVFGYAEVYGNAQVSDNAEVCGDAEICGNAVISSSDDYALFKMNMGREIYITWTKSNNMWKVGTFYGTEDELVQKAYEDSEESGKHYEMCVKLIKETNSI